MIGFKYIFVESGVFLYRYFSRLKTEKEKHTLERIKHKWKLIQASIGNKGII